MTAGRKVPPMPKSKPIDVWIVKHRTGWCATANAGRTRPDRNAISDETACGMFVTMRWGQEKGEPDCPDCLRALRAK